MIKHYETLLQIPRGKDVRAGVTKYVDGEAGAEMVTKSYRLKLKADNILEKTTTVSVY